jgi:rubrerythrin
MDTYSIREAVEMAVQTEKLGYRFYMGMVEKFGEHEGLKELFTTLANMETRHERVFTGLLDKVRDEEPEGWDEAQSYLRAMVESEFFLGSRKALPSMDRVTSVAEAADFALGFERETALFFITLRDAVKDKDLVDEIIKEENRHILWLVRFRESLKS